MAANQEDARGKIHILISQNKLKQFADAVPQSLDCFSLVIVDKNCGGLEGREPLA